MAAANYPELPKVLMSMAWSAGSALRMATMVLRTG
jgi:hypothetical protein